MIRKLLYLCTDNTDPYHNLALEQYLTVWSRTAGSSPAASPAAALCITIWEI